MSDDFNDTMSNYNLGDSDEDSLFDPNVWTTDNGREIPLTELTDDHLGNILRFLQRRAELYRRLNISRMMWYLVPNGPNVHLVPFRMTDDGFRMRANCPEVRSTLLSWFSYRHPQHSLLAAEALRRKLKWDWLGDMLLDNVGRDVMLLKRMMAGAENHNSEEEPTNDEVEPRCGQVPAGA